MANWANCMQQTSVVFGCFLNHLTISFFALTILGYIFSWSTFVVMLRKLQVVMLRNKRLWFLVVFYPLDYTVFCFDHTWLYIQLVNLCGNVEKTPGGDVDRNPGLSLIQYNI